jgi:hypothetical protein
MPANPSWMEDTGVLVGFGAAGCADVAVLAVKAKQMTSIAKNKRIDVFQVFISSGFC